MSEEEAFVRFKLAPVDFRCKVALLGLIHKCVLGLAPPQLCALFTAAPSARHSYPTRFSIRRHDCQLVDLIDGSQSSLLERSLFGLVKFYNALPQDVISLKSVKLFQQALQASKPASLQSSNPRGSEPPSIRALGLEDSMLLVF